MRYDLNARIFPLLFDRSSLRFLREKNDYGITKIKKKIHRTYKEMILRTPGLPKDDELAGNLYTGCYVLSVYKACEGKMTEADFRDLVIALCHCNAMEKAHRKISAFSADQLQKKRKGAEASAVSDAVMGWKYTFDHEEGSDFYDLTYHQCGLCALGKQEGLEHLIRHLCLADYITLEMMGAKLTRTQTLAEGGSCCDFHVEMKEEARS